MGNNPPLTHQVRALHRLSRFAQLWPEGQRGRPTKTPVSRMQGLVGWDAVSDELSGQRSGVRLTSQIGRDCSTTLHTIQQ